MYAVNKKVQTCTEDIDAIAGELRQVMSELLPLGSALLSSTLAQAFELPCSDTRLIEPNTQWPSVPQIENECSSSKKQNKKSELGVSAGTEQVLKRSEQSVGPCTRTLEPNNNNNNNNNNNIPTN